MAETCQNSYISISLRRLNCHVQSVVLKFLLLPAVLQAQLEHERIVWPVSAAVIFNFFERVITCFIGSLFSVREVNDEV